MSRRELFPLRRCPGLVPIRELDDDIVIVMLERSPPRSATLHGHTIAVAAPHEHDVLAERRPA